jgi:catechol 2,3-dioxygenase-like lactoylglutathione lyase family enzyme
MSVELNHIIIPSHDRRAAAEFLAGILGLPVGGEWGPFVPVQMANGVTLDFVDSDDIRTQHCAFLVSEGEFDESFARIKDAGIDYWADPHHQQPSRINHHYGGRGVYFDDPSGHNMEILTQPYGATPA